MFKKESRRSFLEKVNLKKIFFLSFVLAFFLGNVVKAYSLELTFIVGEVNAKRDGKAVSLDAGSKLIDGDIIETGADSIAILEGNGSKIELKENSSLLIDKKVIETGSASIIQGSLFAKYKKVKKGRKRKIYTPTSVAAIRGTEFTIAVSKNGSSRIQMKKGKLDVYNPSGKVAIRKNQKADTVAGQSPARQFDKSSINNWKNKNDKQLEDNPQKVGKDLNKHVKKLGDSTNKDSKQISDLEKNVAALNSSFSLKQSGKKLDKTEERVADNYMLSRSANTSIDSILKDFKGRKTEIYNTFLKIKEESNKVMEQQQRNLEEINKVREAYKKAYAEIMEKHKKSVEEIKNKSKFKKDKE